MKKKTSSPKTAESGKLKKALSCWQLYILLIPAPVSYTHLGMKKQERKKETWQ